MRFRCAGPVCQLSGARSCLTWMKLVAGPYRRRIEKSRRPCDGKAALRDYVNATAGFQDLEKRTRIPAKSLMRMLGPKGKPLRRKPIEHPHCPAKNGRRAFRAFVEVRHFSRRNACGVAVSGQVESLPFDLKAEALNISRLDNVISRYSAIYNPFREFSFGG